MVRSPEDNQRCDETPAPAQPELVQGSRLSRGAYHLVGWVTRHPKTVILGVLLLTACSIFLLRQLQLDTSIYNLFPDQPGPVRHLALYARTFAGDQDVIGLITASEASIVEDTVRQVTQKLSRSPLIARVRSKIPGPELARDLSSSLPLLVPDEHWPQLAKQITSGLDTQVAHLRQLLLSPLSPSRELLIHDPLLLFALALSTPQQTVRQSSGYFATADGKAALLFIRPRRSAAELPFVEQLHRLLTQLQQSVVAPAHQPTTPQIRSSPRAKAPRVQLQFTGAPIYTYYMSQALKHDLLLSTILSLLGIVLVQLFFLRTIRLIPLAALVSGAAIVWTLGLATLSAGMLNALSLSFAALCLGLGLDTMVHITQETQAMPPSTPQRQLQLAIARLAPALLVATLTTAVAFLSFGLSAFAGLSQTGYLATCGLLLNLLLSVLFFPALSIYWPAQTMTKRVFGQRTPPRAGDSTPASQKPGTRQRRQTPLFDASLLWLVHGVQRFRIVILAGLGLLALGGLFLLPRLSFSKDLSRLAPADIPPARTEQAIARSFARQRQRVIFISEGRALQPVLEINDRLSARLAALKKRGVVASYQSLSALLPAHATQRRRLARLDALVSPQQRAARLTAALEAADLRAAAFQPGIHAFAHPVLLDEDALPQPLQPLVAQHLARREHKIFVATMVYLRPGTSDLTALFSLAQLSTPQVQVKVTGAELAGAQMASILEQDLALISLTTFGSVLVLLAVLLRRARPILATLGSLIMAGLLFAATLVLLGIELDLYNLMVIPIIIGYGVDDHLYLIHRSLQRGVRRGMVESGRPIIAATLSTMAAFAALTLCQLPGLRLLGWTGVLGLFWGLFAALVVLPALLPLRARAEIT